MIVMKIWDWFVKNLMRGLAYTIITGLIIGVMYMLTTLIFAPILGALVIILWFAEAIVGLVISGWVQSLVVNKFIK